MKERLHNKREKGQSLGEYGLILALVVVFCIVALQTLGDSISTLLIDSIGQIVAAINGG